MNRSRKAEAVLLEYPYKPFGHLKITASQLIFKRMFPGINTFSGVINVADVLEVKYLKGFPIFGVPGLEIVYRSPGSQTATLRIHFPGYAARLGMELRSGVTPVKISETISSLMKNAHREIIPKPPE